jgi:glycerol-3-phosphate dehydrogenase subunit C
MREGSLEAPTRHALAWRDPDFTDPEKLDAEMRRIFDICHGCRRCFNLCDSFPRLFDLIDESDTGELEAVPSDKFKSVVDACTLCDMCFMTKCPYVPPHEFNVDFPHLMLRYRVKQFEDGEHGAIRRELGKTDRNGKLAKLVPALANWGSDRKNGFARGLLETVAHVHRDAELPLYHGTTFSERVAPPLAAEAPAKGRKAVLYATCFVQYNSPEIGEAARSVLAKNGVETEVVYPRCCGMPQLEAGNIESVAESARAVAKELGGWIDKGYDVIALVPSCALMLKFEWPLIEPENADIKKLAEATYDVSEYIVDIAEKEGLASGLKPLDGGMSIHLACHARAQNMGPKGAIMLRLIPDAKVGVIERCSGHGGSWGVMKENFEVALKVGRPVARTAAESGNKYVVSECPLAREHILQGIERLTQSQSERADADASAQDNPGQGIAEVKHPIQLIAKAYGLMP